MAYALRYYKDITHADGTVFRLEIHKKDSTAAAVEIGAVVQGLSLEVQGQQGDIDTPIVKTSLAMTFVDAGDIDDGRKNGFWEEFYTPDALMWKIVIKAKNAASAALRTVWGGYVTPDSFSEDLVYRGSVTIIARDNIGHMQDFPFDAVGDGDGMISLRNLVESGWEKIGSPMVLDWDEDCLICEGVQAYDTLMNASQFKDRNWYDAIESALYAYGLVMRYIGDNTFMISPLRYMPYQGAESIDLVPHIEPVFIAGAQRELVPAARRIEEVVDYDLTDVVAPAVQPGDFTGDIEYFDIPAQKGAGIAWPINNVEIGSGWCNPAGSMFFNPRAYTLGVDNDDDTFMWLAIDEAYAEGDRYAEYSRYILPRNVAFNLRLGNPYALVEGMLLPAFRLDNIRLCIMAVQNGVVEYLQEDGSWSATNTIMRYSLLEKPELTVNIDLQGYTGGVMLRIQIVNIFTSGVLSTYPRAVPLYNASISEVTALRERNAVNTVYNTENNVIITRDPEFGPAYDRVALPEFIMNGIFYRYGDGIYPARSWGWDGVSPLQMAVYNHLQLLCYYAKPNNLISGTIVNADITRARAIYVWGGREHLLVSGRYNLLNGHIEGATLREFARYDDMWSEVSGTAMPDTEESTASNVEGTSGSSASGYNSTTTVNIGSGGSGGGGASYLNDLLDVDVVGVAAQSILYFNGTEWVAMSKATFLSTHEQRLAALEAMWQKDSEGRLVTSLPVVVDNDIVANGEVSAGGAGEEGDSNNQTEAYRMYHHKQSEPSTQWNIVHGLGKFPNVKIIDSLRQLCYGDVIYEDTNTVLVKFTAAESGDAYLD